MTWDQLGYGVVFCVAVCCIIYFIGKAYRAGRGPYTERPEFWRVVEDRIERAQYGTPVELAHRELYELEEELRQMQAAHFPGLAASPPPPYPPPIPDPMGPPRRDRDARRPRRGEIDAADMAEGLRQFREAREILRAAAGTPTGGSSVRPPAGRAGQPTDPPSLPAGTTGPAKGTRNRRRNVE